MITYKYEYGHYLVYLNGKFIESCENYKELKEVFEKYGVSI